MMRIGLCCPTYSGRVQDALMASVVKTMGAAAARGIEILLITGRGCPILPDARNWCVAQALAASCDKIWFVDADISWEDSVDDAINMLLAPVDIVCGVHQARNPKWNEPARLVVRWKDIPPKEDEATGLWLVDRVATAFVCIDRSVFDRLAESGQAQRYLPNGTIIVGEYLRHYRNYFWLSLDPVSPPAETVAALEALGVPGPYNGLIGEDFLFCSWAEQVGCKIYVDPRLKLVHWDGCVAHDANLGNVRFVKEEEAHAALASSEAA
jgi:hypothetical protein